MFIRTKRQGAMLMDTSTMFIGGFILLAMVGTVAFSYRNYWQEQNFAHAMVEVMLAAQDLRGTAPNYHGISVGDIETLAPHAAEKVFTSNHPWEGNVTLASTNDSRLVFTAQNLPPNLCQAIHNLARQTHLKLRHNPCTALHTQFNMGL